MQNDTSFRRNLTVIGGVHVAVIAAVMRWSSSSAKAPTSNVLWLDGGAASSEVNVASASQPPPIMLPPEQPEDAPVADEPAAVAEQESEIRMPAAPPAPRPVATPRVTPKPTPKASPKPTPKKIVLAKATPPPKPSPSAVPKKRSNESSSPEASPAPTAARDVAAAIAEAAKNGTTPTAGISGTGAGGASGRGIGAGNASQFGWYAHMLHDRFFSQWAQPTSVVRSGAKMSTLVKLRIEKDGAVSRFTILRPSGNVVVDESIAAMAKRVTRVDPLPPGLGDAFYEVNINFELNSEQ